MWLDDRLNIFSSLKCDDEEGTAQLGWFRYDVDRDELRQAFRGLSLGSKIRFEITPSESSSTCAGFISFGEGLQIAFSLVNVMVPAKLVIKSTRTLLVVVSVIVVVDAGSQVQMC
jgi:hypothetical protein